MRQRLFPIAAAGYPYIWVGIGLTALAWMSGWERVAAGLVLLTLFVIAFFRDPDRTTEAKPGEILSPADGRVVIVEELADPRYLTGKWQKVSIFMSVWNAHINRIPLSGTVQQIRYAPGRFLMGFSEKASWENEHNAILIADSAGKKLMLVQIAGFLARRIVCDLNEGDRVQVGDRFGMIRFGSRCDIYLPTEAEVAVVPGDRVKAGRNVIARFRGRKEG